MAIERIFLGWDRPALSLAVDFLCERFADESAIDLGCVSVALPGARAGRRLLELLVEHAETVGLPLCPPQIGTIGQLPERLYTPKRPFADSLSQQMAWVEALKQTPPDQLAHLVAQPPEADNLAGWLSLGEMLARLHRELAAEAMDFQAVLDCGHDRIQNFQEQQRWATLATVQRDYLAVLDRLGLWDRQTARLFAAREGEYRADSPIVLIGTVDLNRLQREMLEQVADRVVSLVFAPPSMADRFDEHGCLHPDAWDELPVAVRDDQIDVVTTPAAQAAAVVGALESFDGRFSAEEVTVGVPDERVVPYLLQHLHESGVAARHGIGRPLAQSGVCRLLDVVAEYLDTSRFDAFAALVRHPDVGSWLDTKSITGDWLTELDRYHRDHLPRRIDGHFLGPPESHALLDAVFAAVDGLTASLNGTARPLGQWSPAIAQWLIAIYGTRPLRTDIPADRVTLAACEKVYAALSQHVEIHPSLMPEVTAAEAIRITLRGLTGQSMASPPDSEAVELLGWLELPLDDAPALIVTGMNEGIVPPSLGADLFLPNQMRRALGIEDNRRRWARDAYALSVLLASGREVRLIAGRRSTEGDPLLPSRLLLAADPETTARRVCRLFRDEDESSSVAHSPGRLVAGCVVSGFVIPEPLPLSEPVESMRVTEFRDYLACPYRYYLRHRLKLESLDDHDEELDGASFGSLAHEVLGRFGRSPLAQSTDPDEIAAFLHSMLDSELKRAYGNRPLASIRVQIEQLRLRLTHFARWQADHAAQGWRIKYVEQGPAADQAPFEVDDRPIYLRGRIDRIDVEEATGRSFILDYKTSDNAEPPAKTHLRNKTQWVDLQLPLYRHLARALGVDGPVALGYVAIPKDPKRIALLKADWTDAQLEEADETARQVVRDIRNGRFWPPADTPPAFSEPFAAICQDGQFGAVFADDENDQEEGGNGE